MIKVKEVLEHLVPGETVLIEHPSKVEPILLFYEIVTWAESKGYPVVIDDVLDTLYLYKRHLELAGKGNSLLDNAKVIKLGGRLNVGQVVGRVRVKDDPIIFEQEYIKAFESQLDEKNVIINPFLGFEKLFLIKEFRRDLWARMYVPLSYIGDRRRIAFYFVNTDVVRSTAPEALPLLEEIASTVFEVGIMKREEDAIGKIAYRFLITKSVNNELSGLEFALV